MSRSERMCFIKKKVLQNSNEEETSVLSVESKLNIKWVSGKITRLGGKRSRVYRVIYTRQTSQCKKKITDAESAY